MALEKIYGKRGFLSMRTRRQGMIVWYQHRRNIKKIRRFGNLIYTSKRMKYAVLYVDQDAIDEIMQKLLKFSFITKVELSQKPFIRTDFEGKKNEKTKPYNYNMEI